jgi:hypothetical protein
MAQLACLAGVVRHPRSDVMQRAALSILAVALLAATAAAPSGWHEVGLRAGGEPVTGPGMTLPTQPSYAGHRFPPEVIGHAV